MRGWLWLFVGICVLISALMMELDWHWGPRDPMPVKGCELNR